MRQQDQKESEITYSLVADDQLALALLLAPLPSVGHTAGSAQLRNHGDTAELREQQRVKLQSEPYILSACDDKLL